MQAKQIAQSSFFSCAAAVLDLMQCTCELKPLSSDQLLHYIVDLIGKPSLVAVHMHMLVELTLCSVVCAVSMLSDGFSFTSHTHISCKQGQCTLSQHSCSKKDWPHCLDCLIPKACCIQRRLLLHVSTIIIVDDC